MKLPNMATYMNYTFLSINLILTLKDIVDLGLRYNGRLRNTQFLQNIFQTYELFTSWAQLSHTYIWSIIDALVWNCFFFFHKRIYNKSYYKHHFKFYYSLDDIPHFIISSKSNLFEKDSCGSLCTLYSRNKSKSIVHWIKYDATTKKNRDALYTMLRYIWANNITHSTKNKLISYTKNLFFVDFPS